MDQDHGAGVIDIMDAFDRLLSFVSPVGCEIEYGARPVFFDRGRHLARFRDVERDSVRIRTMQQTPTGFDMSGHREDVGANAREGEE